MTANKTGANTYSGKLYSTRGPAFNSAAFDPLAVSATEAGTGTLTFTDASNGTFSYAIGSVSQSKAITRQAFGTMPTCTFGTTAQPRDGHQLPGSVVEEARGHRNRAGASTSTTRATRSSRRGSPTTSTARRCGSWHRAEAERPASTRVTCTGRRDRAFSAVPYDSTKCRPDEGRHRDADLCRRQQRDLRLYGAARGHGGAGHAIEGDHPRDLHCARYGLPIGTGDTARPISGSRSASARRASGCARHRPSFPRRPSRSRSGRDRGRAACGRRARRALCEWPWLRGA